MKLSEAFLVGALATEAVAGTGCKSKEDKAWEQKQAEWAKRNAESAKRDADFKKSQEDWDQKQAKWKAEQAERDIKRAERKKDEETMVPCQVADDAANGKTDFDVLSKGTCAQVREAVALSTKIIDACVDVQAKLTNKSNTLPNTYVTNAAQTLHIALEQGRGKCLDAVTLAKASDYDKKHYKEIDLSKDVDGNPIELSPEEKAKKDQYDACVNSVSGLDKIVPINTLMKKGGNCDTMKQFLDAAKDSVSKCSEMNHPDNLQYRDTYLRSGANNIEYVHKYQAHCFTPEDEKATMSFFDGIKAKLTAEQKAKPTQKAAPKNSKEQ